jgi:hypothetical protein
LQLQNELKGKDTKQEDKWHIVYVLLELFKMLGILLLMRKTISTL